MRLLIDRARREPRRKVLPFKRPALKRAPYQPSAANGVCYAIKCQLVEYHADSSEVTVGAVDYAAIHVSASGDSVGGPGGGFATMAEAEQAAWREARRRNAFFVPSNNKGTLS